MASTYLRPDSPYVWLRYKDQTGKWRNSNTGYRQDSTGERRQAGLMARERSLEEMAIRPLRGGKTEFDQWVIPWMDQRWGHSHTVTLDRYKRNFMKLRKYFAEIKITSPVALTREHVLNYLAWRAVDRKPKRSIAIQELKFLAMVLDEAMNRGFIKTNVARRTGLSAGEHKPKTPWTDEEIAIVGRALAEMDEFGWMHVTFLMGLYQASRLQQSAVPLRLIDFNRGLINYADEGVKGGKGFSQPIDPDFAPILRALAGKRKALGKSTLCDIPTVPSILWRNFLDSLNLKHLCHHGLRASWITRAALAGIPESQTRRFANHSSQAVHSIYQRITANDLKPIFGALRQPALQQAREIEATACNDRQ